MSSSSSSSSSASAPSPSKRSECSYDSSFELVENPTALIDPRRLDPVVHRVKINNLKRKLEGTWCILSRNNDKFLRETGDEDELSRVLFYTAKRSIKFDSDNCMELAYPVNTTKYKLQRIPIGGPFNLDQLGVTAYFTENSVKVVWGLDEEAGMNSEEFTLGNERLYVFNRRFDQTCTRIYIKLDYLTGNLYQLSRYRVDNKELRDRCSELELEKSELFGERATIMWQLDEMGRQLRDYNRSPKCDQVRVVDEMLRKLHLTAVHPSLVTKQEPTMEMPEIYAYILGSWEMVGDREAVPREFHSVTYAYNTKSCKLWRKLADGPFEEIYQEIVVLDATKMMIVESENWKYMRVAKAENDQMEAAAVNNGHVSFVTLYKRV